MHTRQIAPLNRQYRLTRLRPITLPGRSPIHEDMVNGPFDDLFVLAQFPNL